MSSSGSSRQRQKPPPQKRPPWVDLPGHITASILQKLGGIEMIETAQKVCSAWRSICKDPSTWRVIHMTNSGPISRKGACVKMCRQAVDLSQGQLVDVKIEYFATDDLIAYIGERSGHLRRLQLVCCCEVRGGGFIQAARKLPLLEELHLYDVDVETEAILAVGRSCPLLKSFTLNQEFCHYSEFEDEFGEDEQEKIPERDDEALAIASSMPKLQHLQLFGNRMTNKGLIAILDNCPMLESLDLRQCLNLNLDGGLGARCSRQIKDLKLPNESGYPCNCRDSSDSESPEDYLRRELLELGALS